MDKEGFRKLLLTRNLNDMQVEAAMVMAERFERYLATQPGTPDAALVCEFTKILIREGQNTYDNLLTLARYGRFTKNNDIYVAVLELLDGAEVQPNLYQKVGVIFGDEMRDEVFAGIGISPLGRPSIEKPFDMFPVIDRLVEKAGYEQTRQLLSACLRDLPDEHFLEAREQYHQSTNIDDYLAKKHQALVKLLEKCQQDGELFYSQEITPEVVQYVQDHPETECGVRKENILYITKIPYNAKEYLVEADPIMKRYYACHCPWVREAIRSGAIHMNPVFCHCSGGYSKKPWEVIFGQKLHVEVLESALNGDFRCRFAVYLPQLQEMT